MPILIILAGIGAMAGGTAGVIKGVDTLKKEVDKAKAKKKLDKAQ